MNIDLVKILGISEWPAMGPAYFFRSCLDSMIDLRHRPALLVTMS